MMGSGRLEPGAARVQDVSKAALRGRLYAPVDGREALFVFDAGAER